jgi:uncharacterized membrane protein
MNGHLWIKALHVVFVVAWFAGVFHLPRIFVNLADVEDVATRDHAWCALLYAKFASGRNAHSPAWFRCSTKRRCCCPPELSRWPLSNRSEDAI